MYITVTLAIYGVTVTLACVIPSVTIVFGFIAAFSVTAIVFTLPGLFYYMGYKKYQPEQPQKFRYCMSIFYLGFGIFTMFFLLAVQILIIIEAA